MPEEIGAVATADAGIDSAAIETTDQGLENASEPQESVDQSGTQTGNTDVTQQTAQKSRPTLENVLQSSKDQLKAINPSLPGLIRDANAIVTGIKREFPQGGLREAVKIRDAYQAIGGEEGIQSTQAALNDFNALSDLFEKGDAAFLSNLFDEGADKISAMMPQGLERWRQADPDGYSYSLAQVMLNTLDQGGISQRLANAWKASKEQETKDAIEQVWQTIESFRAIPKPQQKVDPNAQKLTQREQQVQQREMDAFMSPITSAGDARIKTVAERELAQSYQWDQTDPDVKDALLERVRLELGKQLKKNPAYTGPRDRMKAAGNADGLKKHIQQHFDRTIPTIVQRVSKLFNVKPKNAAPAQKATVQTQVKTEVGWQRRTGPPSASQVDRGKTTEDMIFSGKAILKDGSKVVWA